MTKERLKQLFEKHKGEFLSGEKIAESLGITRAAVWKAIKNLKEEGYAIESVKKKGYRLNIYSDIISLIKIQEYLDIPIKEEQIHIYKEIDSTSKQALIQGIEGAEGWTVIIAKQQTQGMTKHKQTYQSPKGQGIYLSILLKPQVDSKELEGIKQWVMDAMIQTLFKMTGIVFEGNIEEGAIYYQHKKLGGVVIQVLGEAHTTIVEQMVIGIGINIYGELSSVGVAGEDNISLYSVTEIYYNRSQIIAELLNHFYRTYNTKRCLE